MMLQLPLFLLSMFVVLTLPLPSQIQRKQEDQSQRDRIERSPHPYTSINKNTAKRCVKENGVERCKIAIQSNNPEVDDRGYIYVVDRAGTGMHILELTGDARKIANFPK